ncbi:MAG: hypothetical protein LBU87_05825, partial [Lactobacillales bacterium]|nr:hypothetical protein [Lactobacillales bacterium]
ILKKAAIFDTLADAIKDIHYCLATTARERGMTKPIFSPESGIKKITAHLKRNHKTAILFGAERTGLENHEVAPASGIIEIPLNPAFSSLNLSQAVLLVGYEYFKSTQKNRIDRLHTGGSKMATKDETTTFLNYLEQSLGAKGYFRFADKTDRMKRNLENIFTRTDLTKSEIKTLFGVIKELIRKD